MNNISYHFCKRDITYLICDIFGLTGFHGTRSGVVDKPLEI